MTDITWKIFEMKLLFTIRKKKVLQKIEIRVTINNNIKILIISSIYLTMEIYKANVTKTK